MQTQIGRVEFIGLGADGLNDDVQMFVEKKSYTINSHLNKICQDCKIESLTLN